MSGFIGNDGSELAGGINPSGVVQGMLVDSAGRLLTANYINGSPVGVSNPYPSADQLRGWLQNGQVFSATTGSQAAPAGAAVVGLALVNPANSGKSIYVFAARIYYATSIGKHQLNMYAVDPALTGLTGMGPYNLKAGGPASVATVEGQNTNIATLNGNQVMPGATTGNTPFDFLANRPGILLPAGVSVNSVALYINSNAASTWAAEFDWVEY